MSESNGHHKGPQRDARGRFVPGCAGGPGNPHLRKVNRLRTALLKAVTPEDVEEILATLIEAAKKGDTVAAREVLDRTIGKAVATDILQRLEAIEEALAQENRL